MNLAPRDLVKIDFPIALPRWVKNVVVDAFCLRPDSIHPPDALQEARSIPRRVIVDDDIGPMQVNAFGQDIRCDYYAIIVSPYLRIGIKVFSNRIE